MPEEQDYQRFTDIEPDQLPSYAVEVQSKIDELRAAVKARRLLDPDDFDKLVQTVELCNRNSWIISGSLVGHTLMRLRQHATPEQESIRDILERVEGIPAIADSLSQAESQQEENE